MATMTQTPSSPTAAQRPPPFRLAAAAADTRRKGTPRTGLDLLKMAGGVLAFGSLVLSGAFFYRISSDVLGPGAFMLSIPKILAASLAPFIAVAGATGSALGVVCGLLDRRAVAEVARKPTARGVAGVALGVPLTILAGVASAAIATTYVQRVTAPHGGFEQAFGADWQHYIAPERQAGMLAQRWTWVLPGSPEPRVERDVAYGTVPGTERTLLADLWQPPAGVRPSGLAFIHLHGGGHASFDKGLPPNEPWFRHLAAQGHVVMDVAYRLVPETNVPGMQGDVKRAIVWMKRHAARYGVNPDRIVLGGDSAGAHLALLAAYAPDDPLLTPADVRGENLAVRGVVNYYAVADYRLESKPLVQRGPVGEAAKRLLTDLLERWSGATVPSDDEWSAQFTGGQREDWPERYRRVSPITHVGPDAPPTLQFVGAHDVYVSRGGSILALHRKLQAAGVPSVYVEFPQTDHAFDMILPELSPAAQAAMYDVDRFLALMASPVDWKTGHSSRQEAVAR
jgi:acetyl esterase/lipase